MAAAQHAHSLINGGYVIAYLLGIATCFFIMHGRK